MIGKRLVESHPITVYEAKKVLEDGMKEVEEPLYEQKITYDYLLKFAKLEEKEARNITKEIKRVSDRIKPEIAVKIADLMPRDEEDLKAIIAKERFVLEKDELAGILEVLKGYIKEK